MNKQEVKIISHSIQNMFEEMVNDHLAAGWRINGKMVILAEQERGHIHTTFYQPIKRTTRPGQTNRVSPKVIQQKDMEPENNAYWGDILIPTGCKISQLTKDREYEVLKIVGNDLVIMNDEGQNHYFDIQYWRNYFKRKGE